ncbi:hypothetical protein MKW92_042256 [Papaver armeniacum]|nr:hypothetical protein MKW92_042256 [Papaver armeniacum]
MHANTTWGITRGLLIARMIFDLSIMCAKPIDIFLSHDRHVGITDYGNRLWIFHQSLDPMTRKFNCIFPLKRNLETRGPMPFNFVQIVPPYNLDQLRGSLSVQSRNPQTLYCSFWSFYFFLMVQQNQNIVLCPTAPNI